MKKRTKKTTSVVEGVLVEPRKPCILIEDLENLLDFVWNMLDTQMKYRLLHNEIVITSQGK